jgi:hypothetical protein
MTTKKKPLPKLCPCPFCDSKKIYIRVSFKYCVACENERCLAEGPVRYTERGAINAWNRRYLNG